MQDSRNMILAIVLSIAVLFGWQYFVVGPQLEQQARDAQIAAERAGNAGVADLATPAANGAGPAQPAMGGSSVQSFDTREAALAAQPRVEIDSAALHGSINLVGARLDELELKEYHETVDPDSPIIELLNPANGPNGYFVEQGWRTPVGGAEVKLPDANTQWVQENEGPLSETNPVTLKWDNGEGLIFRQRFEVDEHYLFTVTQSVQNTGADQVLLHPYARVVRQGTPQVQNFFVLHEGPLGVLGDANLIEKTYQDLAKEKRIDVEASGGWLGFTDKYWATTILPEPQTQITARFSAIETGAGTNYQTSFVEQNGTAVPAGGSATHKSYVFAGAKVESTIDSYEQTYGFDRIELLIDWGWFHFLTKPMFKLIRFLNSILGNFGLAILAVTLIMKALFFPLANRSYASMAAMRRVQPEMKEIQERHKDDRMAQQQAMMALYKREKINPIAGCWPMLIQIPVFFSLYKVLFVTIEMRHAPFFGWIEDLAAQDPTNVFNLFGLLPYDPTALPVIGGFLAIGIWPLIMGVTMWVQMKLNPPPPDPTQAMIFAFMPIIFTFMLGTFPAGLVIYWAWNNFLSILQQYVIMRRHGVKPDLFGNILATFRRKPANDKSSG